MRLGLKSGNLSSLPSLAAPYWQANFELNYEFTKLHFFDMCSSFSVYKKGRRSDRNNAGVLTTVAAPIPYLISAGGKL